MPKPFGSEFNAGVLKRHYAGRSGNIKFKFSKVGKSKAHKQRHFDVKYIFYYTE